MHPRTTGKRSYTLYSCNTVLRSNSCKAIYTNATYSCTVQWQFITVVEYNEAPKGASACRGVGLGVGAGRALPRARW